MIWGQPLCDANAIVCMYAKNVWSHWEYKHEVIDGTTTKHGSITNNEEERNMDQQRNNNET